MEDDLKFKMEDDLNLKKKKEDDLNFKKNERQPKKKWKTTSQNRGTNQPKST
jgi:hypothetical protein